MAQSIKFGDDMFIDLSAIKDGIVLVDDVSVSGINSVTTNVTFPSESDSTYIVIGITPRNATQRDLVFCLFNIVGATLNYKILTTESIAEMQLESDRKVKFILYASYARFRIYKLPM